MLAVTSDDTIGNTVELKGQDYANSSAPACVNIRYAPDGWMVSQPCAMAAFTATRYSS